MAGGTADQGQPEEAQEVPQEEPAAPISVSRNIHQRLLAVIGEIGTLPKTGKSGGGLNYNFFEYAELMARLSPLLVRHGILCVPSLTAVEYATTPSGKQQDARIAMEFTLVNVDDPTDRIVTPWMGQGADSGDKSISKAGTSAVKYFWMKMLLISDKEDPDYYESDDEGRGRGRQIQRRQAPRGYTEPDRKTGEMKPTGEGKITKDQATKIADLNRKLNRAVQVNMGISYDEATQVIANLANEINRAGKPGATPVSPEGQEAMATKEQLASLKALALGTKYEATITKRTAMTYDGYMTSLDLVNKEIKKIEQDAEPAQEPRKGPPPSLSLGQLQTIRSLMIKAGVKGDPEKMHLSATQADKMIADLGAEIGKQEAAAATARNVSNTPVEELEEDADVPF